MPKASITDNDLRHHDARLPRIRSPGFMTPRPQTLCLAPSWNLAATSSTRALTMATEAANRCWVIFAPPSGRASPLGDPAWRSMVCVETGNIADNEVRLAADDEHQMSTAISVDAG